MYEPVETSEDLIEQHKDTPDWIKQVLEEESKFDKRPDTHNGTLTNLIKSAVDKTDPWNPWPACKNEFFSALEVVFSKEKKDFKKQDEQAVSHVPSNFHKSLNTFKDLSLVYELAEQFYRKILLLERASTGQLRRKAWTGIQVDGASKSKFEKIVLGALPENRVEKVSIPCLAYISFIEKFRLYLLRDEGLYNTFLYKVNLFKTENSLSVSQTHNAQKLIVNLESLEKEKQKLELQKAEKKNQKKHPVNPVSLPSTEPSVITKFFKQIINWLIDHRFDVLKYTVFLPWTFGKWTATKLDKYNNPVAGVLSFILKLIVSPGELFKNTDAWISKNSYDKNWGRFMKGVILLAHIAIWITIGVFAPPLLGQLGLALTAEFLPAIFSVLESFAWGISAVQVFSVLCTWVYMGLYHLMPSGNNVPIVNNVVNTAPMAVLNPSSSGVLDSSENNHEFNPYAALTGTASHLPEPSYPITTASASTLLGSKKPAQKVEPKLSIAKECENAHQPVVPL